MKKYLSILGISTMLVFSLSHADGWSETGLTSPVQIELVTIKDDNSVLVKFTGVGKFFYFSNHPQLLATLLSAKASGSNVRAWTSSNTGYYNTTDLPPGGITSANYLGAVQIVD